MRVSAKVRNGGRSKFLQSAIIKPPTIRVAPK